MIKALPVLVASLVLLGAAGAHAADPTTSDCLTAAETSIDLRTLHKLRDARAQLLVCAETSCPHDVRVECLRRLDAVNALIPTVVFDVKDASGSELSGVKVTMDGRPLSERLAGTAVSLDPGDHHFVFEAPSGVSVEKTLTLKEAEKERREPIVFDAPQPAESVRPDAEVRDRGPGVAGPSPPSGGGNARRTLGFMLGGAGIAGIAVGGVFGLVAISSWNSSKSECDPSGTPCPDHAHALSDHDRAVTAGNLATAGFVAGGALVAGGIALLISSRSTSHRASQAARLVVSPNVGRSAAALSVAGAF